MEIIKDIAVWLGLRPKPITIKVADERAQKALLKKFDKVNEQFEKISRRLTHFDLKRSDCSEGILSEDDISRQLFDHTSSNFFLDYYSPQGLQRALRIYGFYRKLKQLGLRKILTILNLENPFEHSLRLYYGGKEDPEHLVAEVVLKKGTLKPKQGITELFRDEEYQLLIINWLMLQDPTKSFSASRPRLPGQKYPGLGLGHEVLGLLIRAGERLEMDGLMNFPQHFHNATLYHHKFFFFKPIREGIFRAMERDTKGHPLVEVSWAVEKNCLIDAKTNEPVFWRGIEMILPISEKLQRYFESDEYKSKVKEAFESNKFYIDWEKFKQLKANGELYED